MTTPADAPPDDRPTIVCTVDLHFQNEAAIRSLRRDPDLFVLQRQLVAVRHDPDDGKHLHPLTVETLRARMSRVANWKKWNEKAEDEIPCAPPAATARAVLEDGQWTDLRKLVAISQEPILRPDGSIVQRPGYDEKTRVLYAPTKEFPTIPERPSPAHIRRAIDVLLGRQEADPGVTVDFPFKSGADRAAWLAMVLTPLARHAFEGPAPLFLVSATTRGTGKSLLAKIAGLIATGVEPAAAPPVDDDNEMRKRITSLLLDGERVALLDNCTGGFGWPSLDTVLTTTRHSDRILGSSQSVKLDARTVWYATANNPRYEADAIRRVLPVRLDTPHDRPEDRPVESFHHRNVIGYVHEHRPRLACAALTILRGFFLSKRDLKLKGWGGYEGWSEVVRGAVLWAFGIDPIESREEMKGLDEQASQLERLINGLAEGVWRDDEFTAADVLQRLTESPHTLRPLRDVVYEIAAGPRGEPTTRALGRKFAELRGRRVGGARLDFRTLNGGKLWRIVREAQPGEVGQVD